MCVVFLREGTPQYCSHSERVRRQPSCRAMSEATNILRVPKDKRHGGEGEVAPKFPVGVVANTFWSNLTIKFGCQTYKTNVASKMARALFCCAA